MKKSSVPLPEKKMAVFGSKPIKRGPSTVEPNMASTCCRPTSMDCPQGSRSSGAMMPPLLRVHPVKYPCFSTVAIKSSSCNDVHNGDGVEELIRDLSTVSARKSSFRAVLL